VGSSREVVLCGRRCDVEAHQRRVPGGLR
jgi:hypothetical protein